MNILAVKHNIEVAHRLSLLPGKCENIHGHSMWVTMAFEGLHFDENGILGGLNFSDVKKAFRAHLDSQYDHRLLLNQDDPWAQSVNPTSFKEGPWTFLPGLRACEGDPTTENIAKWIQEWGHDYYGVEHTIRVTVWETSVNMAEVVS